MNAREQKLALATGAVLGGVLLFSFVIEPGWTRWQESSKEVASLERSVELDRELKAELPRLDTERNELEANLRPPEGVGLTSWLIEHMETMALDVGFKPTSLRYVGTQPLLEGAKGGRSQAKKTPFAELRFELRAKAPLRKIQRFLIQLAASKRHVRVVSLSLTTPPRGKTMEATVSLLALAPADLVKEAQ